MSEGKGDRVPEEGTSGRGERRLVLRVRFTG